MKLSGCVAGRGVTLIRRVFEGAPAGAINLGLGQPTDPVPELVRQAALAAAAERTAPYTQTAGLPELRGAIGERVYEGAPAASVLVTAGTQEGLWVLLMGIVDRGMDVLIPEPAYPAYRVVTEMIGARVIPVPLRFEDRWRLDIDAVRRAWTPSTRAICLGSPSNPTGMAAGTDAELEAIHALCVERDAWLVADEIYAPLAFARTHSPLHRLGDRVVSLGGISKAFACMGFRVGWIQGNPELIAGLLPLHQQVTLCASTIGQKVALACLSLWGEDHFATLRDRYRQRVAAGMDELGLIDGVRFHAPDGGFYVLADVSCYTSDTAALAMRLRDEALVLTAPGEAFGAASTGLLRLSLATDVETIREGVRRIAGFLRHE